MWPRQRGEHRADPRRLYLMMVGRTGGMSYRIAVGGGSCHLRMMRRVSAAEWRWIAAGGERPIRAKRWRTDITDMTLSPQSVDMKCSPQRISEYRRAIYDAKAVTGRSGRKINIWPTGITEPSGDFLRDLVVRENAQRTLEVGLGLGLSSIAIVEGLLANDARARSRSGAEADDLRGVSHTTMDYAQSNRDHAGERTLEDSGAATVTRFIARDSCVALAQLMSDGERFDFAFIDGGHQFDPLIVDVFFALRLVKPDGLIVLDDHWMPAVQTVLAFCTTNWGLELELFDTAGPGARLVAFRNNGKAHLREWDHFRPFSTADLPKYTWRTE